MNLSKSDKIAGGLFITICIILWFCVQTGGHYDFILHRIDKEAHKGMQERIGNVALAQITSQKEEQIARQEEINPLKEKIKTLEYQIEVLRMQVNQLSPQ